MVHRMLGRVMTKQGSRQDHGYVLIIEGEREKRIKVAAKW